MYSSLAEVKQVKSGELGLSKLLAIVVAVALFLAVAFVLVFESTLSQRVEDTIFEEINLSSLEIEDYIQDKTLQYANDLRFLHATPPIAGLSKTLTSNSKVPIESEQAGIWKSRLEITFSAFMQSNAEIDQLRVISALEQGKEVVRVERQSGRVGPVLDADLQYKASRDYFSKSINLAPNELYMSAISLNREHGKIEYPYKPVFRLSLPFFNENGSRIGFIIMNVNASFFLQGITNFVPPSSELYMTDTEGFFISHPQSRFQYTRDLAKQTTWETQFNETLQEGKRRLTPINAVSDKDVFVVSRQIVVSNSPGSEFLYVHLALPEKTVSSLVNDRRLSIYGFLAVMSLLFSSVLAVFHKSAKNSLALAEARGESAAIVAGSTDAIVSTDSKGIIKSWNMAAERLFQISSQTAMGRHFSQFEVLDPFAFKQYVTDGVMVTQRIEDEVLFELQSGKKVFLAVTVSPILSDQQQFSGLAIVIRDITEAKQAKDAINRLNSNLEEKVVSRTKELAEARDEAQKASKVKSAFISNISHEMRTPLNGVVGSLSLLKTQTLSPKAEQLVNMMDVSCNNLNVLINDILDLSKIEAGKLDLNMSSFSPKELIESLSLSLAAKAYGKQLEFLVDTTALDAELVLSDPHRISQIINNLVNNAIKFTDNGHIALTAALSHTSANQLELHVSVTDTGIGIPKQNQSKLFTAFTQADASVSTRFGGTGLGLSICKQMCLLLGGDISFFSSEGRGSTFSFWVCVQEEQCDAESERQVDILSQKRVAVFAEYLPLNENICSLIISQGGDISEIYVHDVNIEDVPWGELDIIVVDSDNPILMALDKAWNTLNESCKWVKLCMLQSVDGNVQDFVHLKPMVINKPVFISEFINALHPESNKTTVIDPYLGKQGVVAARDREGVRGAHVLIVDDNSINIEVAKGVLDNLAVSISTADNGKEALDIIKRCEDEGRNVHCIIMDCQMPIMDGYTCTRKLREGIAGQVHQGVPVIAMTANAMHGGKEKCLSAGMNDYVTKPIDASVVEAKVINWIVKGFSAGMLAESPVIEQMLTQSPAQEVVWDKQGALNRLAHNDVLFGQICAIYVKSAPEKLLELDDAVRIKDMAAIKLISHSLKGMSGDVGAIELHARFSEIEQFAKNNQIDRVEASLVAVSEDLNLLLAMLKAA